MITVKPLYKTLLVAAILIQSPSVFASIDHPTLDIDATFQLSMINYGGYSGGSYTISNINTKSLDYVNETMSEKHDSQTPSTSTILENAISFKNGIPYVGSQAHRVFPNNSVPYDPSGAYFQAQSLTIYSSRVIPLPFAPENELIPVKVTATGKIDDFGNTIAASVGGIVAGSFVSVRAYTDGEWLAPATVLSLGFGSGSQTVHEWTGSKTFNLTSDDNLLEIWVDTYVRASTYYRGGNKSYDVSAWADPIIEIDPNYAYADYFKVIVSRNLPEYIPPTVPIPPSAMLMASGLFGLIRLGAEKKA